MTGLVISRRRYRALVRDLSERGRGDRESGAFLLSRRGSASVEGRRVVDEYALYDDLDPDSLVGWIEMHPIGFARLNALCRERGLELVGDAHTHPFDHVMQSKTDADHPMSAFAGHIALIVPWYAKRNPLPRELGVHEYFGGGKWQSRFGREAQAAFTLLGGLRLWAARRRSSHGAAS
jgi:hypothetical protein